MIQSTSSKSSKLAELLVVAPAKLRDSIVVYKRESQTLCLVLGAPVTSNTGL